MSAPVAPLGGPGHWTGFIDEIVAGGWIDPETGKNERVPYATIVIEESLAGREAELVAPLGLGRRLGIVSDGTTHAVLGARIEAALGGIASCESIVLDHPHADSHHVELLRERTAHLDGIVAVGSGTINDLCKYVTFLDGKKYCVFATASSMNGYTSTTASITLDSGFKVSFAAHAPLGVFIDLRINAAAPVKLKAAGLGDSLCRSTAQVDWWLSHRLFGTAYSSLPFRLQARDEPAMLEHAPGLAAGETDAVGYLHRVLILVGFGVWFVGATHPGSMGEHQISHYIDSFAGAQHPGTTHGQQVGVASLTMARLQHALFARETPPRVRPTRIDRAELASRLGPENADKCIAEWSHKALDEKTADELNQKLDALWPSLREECRSFMLPLETMRGSLAAAGGATTALELGLDPDLYRTAVLHAREMRNRYSVLDLLGDSGELAALVEHET
jgi:glycerol-1-phosphate dehydrogenase [NAD(P)+]